MKNNITHGTRWIRLSGWLTIVLGSIHIAATPFIYALSTSLFADADMLANLYMFEMTGLAVIFTGWLIIYAAKGWQDGQRWAWHLCLGAGVFLLLLGIGAVLAMSVNPFAYLSLVIAIIENLPVWIYRKDFK
jgi:hypothetical protein